jgi:two-component system KDP operon response regulator KdpE
MKRESVHLTPTERRLLNFLVRNAGRIVSHSKLLEAMSPGNSNKSIHHLRAYIVRLRKKIEIDPAHARVITNSLRFGIFFRGEGRGPVVSRIGTMMTGIALRA